MIRLALISATQGHSIVDWLSTQGWEGRRRKENVVTCNVRGVPTYREQLHTMP